MGYIPLDFCKNVLQDGEPFAVIQHLFEQSKMPNAGEITEDEFIHYALSDRFCTKNCPEKFQAFDKNLYTNPAFLNFIIQNAGASPKDFQDGAYSIATEWRDYLLGPCLWSKWARNKQVYKPDRDFAEALIGTEKLVLTREQIGHLPCKAIYIDMEDCSTEPAMGAFVFVVDNATSVSIAVYLLTSDLLYFSFYGGGEYDENGILQIPTEEIQKVSHGFEVFPNHAEKVGMDCGVDGEPLHLVGKHDRVWVTRFAMQLLCYLSSHKPDIAENPVTKQTYKPSNTIRNRFSEVQKWDVGLRYGKAVREKVAREKDVFLAKKAEPQEGNSGKKPRKSPIPHFRSAHWQRYWTGEGRKVCEVKWIEPVFVGFSEAKDVVVHKVS